jgi:hypothetical protein
MTDKTKRWFNKQTKHEALVIGCKLILIGGCSGYEEVTCINHLQACEMASHFTIH